MFSLEWATVHTGRGVNKNKAILVVLTWNSLSPGMCEITSLQRCPCPDPQNLWICYITQQRGIMVANQLTLKMGSCCISIISQLKNRRRKKNRESILNYPDEPNVVAKVLKNVKREAA